MVDAAIQRAGQQRHREVVAGAHQLKEAFGRQHPQLGVLQRPYTAYPLSPSTSSFVPKTSPCWRIEMLTSRPAALTLNSSIRPDLIPNAAVAGSPCKKT